MKKNELHQLSSNNYSLNCEIFQKDLSMNSLKIEFETKCNEFNGLRMKILKISKKKNRKFIQVIFINYIFVLVLWIMDLLASFSC